jgi:type IV pilus assembly protein PilW
VNATHAPSWRGSAGMTLVELMVAMVLGLMVAGAAVGIFLSNRQAYGATDNLGRVQENARVAFELMARDIREAGGNACNRGLPVANVLNNPTANWWSNWANSVRGYDDTVAFAGVAFGSGNAQRVSGTDAIELKSGTSTGVTVVSHVPASAEFHVNTVDHDLDDGDIAIVCDRSLASVFQVTNAQPGTNNNVVHNIGNSVSPGNCTQYLGLPVPTTCTGGSGTPHEYGPNSTIVKMQATAWYIGNNGRGGRSLYQIRVVNGAANPEEVAEDVTDMQLTYLIENATGYVTGTGVADWSRVTAVRVDIALESPGFVSTNGQPIRRRLVHVATLRNRNG